MYFSPRLVTSAGQPPIPPTPPPPVYHLSVTRLRAEDQSHPCSVVTLLEPGHPLDPWSLCAAHTVSERERGNPSPPTHHHLRSSTYRPPSPHRPVSLVAISSRPPKLTPPSPPVHTLPRPPTPILTMQLSLCPAISQHSAGPCTQKPIVSAGRRQHTVRAAGGR